MKLLTSFLILSAAQGFVVPGEMGVVMEKLVDTIPPIGQTDPLELAKTALVPFIKMRLLMSYLILSTAQGFVVPGEMGVVMEKLVDTIPPIGQIDPLELAAKTALLPFIIYAPFSQQTLSPKHTPTLSEEEIDYDAPLERQLKVGHIVRRQPYTVGLGNVGSVTFPGPIQESLHLYKPESNFQLPEFDEQYFTLIHDECYLGKDLTAENCVDFDPLHVRISSLK